MASEIAVGQQAPEFTLRDDQNEPVSLADLRGRTDVLMFYPHDFSPLCEGEFRELREAASHATA